MKEIRKHSVKDVISSLQALAKNLIIIMMPFARGLQKVARQSISVRRIVMPDKCYCQISVTIHLRLVGWLIFVVVTGSLSLISCNLPPWSLEHSSSVGVRAIVRCPPAKGAHLPRALVLIEGWDCPKLAGPGTKGLLLWWGGRVGWGGPGLRGLQPSRQEALSAG